MFIYVQFFYTIFLIPSLITLRRSTHILFPHPINNRQQQNPFFTTHDWPLNLSLSSSTHLTQLFIKWENEKRAFVCNNVCECVVWCCSISWSMNLWEYIQGSIIMCTFSYIKRNLCLFMGFTREWEKNRTTTCGWGTGDTLSDNML